MRFDVVNTHRTWLIYPTQVYKKPVILVIGRINPFPSITLTFQSYISSNSKDQIPLFFR